MARAVAVAIAGWVAVGLCGAQTGVAPEPPRATFGVTVVDTTGLEGKVYHIKHGAARLPNFQKMKPRGSIYTTELNIPPRHWLEGFPGVTKRFEWFAIDYSGRFWTKDPGVFRFALVSDD